MAVHAITLAELRRQGGQAIDRVRLGGEMFVVMRYGRRAAYILPTDYVVGLLAAAEELRKLKGEGGSGVG